MAIPGRPRCVLCDVEFAATTGARVVFQFSPGVDYCPDCTPYLQVVLPMAKIAREKALKGELL